MSSATIRTWSTRKKERGSRKQERLNVRSIAAGGRDHPVDVYRLIYPDALFSWAHGKNPNFDDVAEAVFAAMKPLRADRYRSIGFIAHSLGGNVVATYLTTVKVKLGHPQRSENAYLIALATPMLGAQIANLGWRVKWFSHMCDDDLLDSLKQDNLYLRMLNSFSRSADIKALRYGCRPVNLYAAFEEKRMGPFRVVAVR